MKPLLALLGVAILSSSLAGAVAEGENLLINGAFDAEQVDFPDFWSPSAAKDVIYNRVGGPEGKKPSVTLKRDGASPGTVSLRQQGLTLVAGETYRLSIYIKTKGFRSRYAGAVIHNSVWTSAVGITALPADSDWTFHEKTFTLIPSKNNEYGLAMFACDPTGEVHFADVRLEAVSQAAGLNGWTASPAVEGSLRTQTIAGYGKNSQGRWGAGSAGDTVCVMTRCAAKPNRIHQVAEGLEVGRVYCLQFVTADLNDVLGNKYNPRRYGIDVELEGAEILGDKSFVHIDRRNAGRYEDNNNVAKINLHRIVFRPGSPTQVVAFHDEQAALGDELIINFVQLKPYLE